MKKSTTYLKEFYYLRKHLYNNGLPVVKYYIAKQSTLNRWGVI